MSLGSSDNPQRFWDGLKEQHVVITSVNIMSEISIQDRKAFFRVSLNLFMMCLLYFFVHMSFMIDPLCFDCVAFVELYLDISSTGLSMVVPWSLPEELQDDALEPGVTLRKIFKKEVGVNSLFTSVIMNCMTRFHPNYVQCCVKEHLLCFSVILSMSSGWSVYTLSCL